MAWDKSLREDKGFAMKTMAIRLDDDLHARLTILARLSETTVTDAVREAIEAHVERLAADPTISAKADAMADEIERDARDQRAALAGLFGKGTTGDEAELPSSAARVSRKPS